MRYGRMNNDSKVRKMWILLECECSADNSKVRIYLPGMRKNRWSKIKKACQKAFGIGIMMLTAAAITSPIALWFIRSAYLERGYHAYGGEWLLIVIVYLLCFKMLGVLLKND